MNRQDIIDFFDDVKLSKVLTKINPKYKRNRGYIVEVLSGKYPRNDNIQLALELIILDWFVYKSKKLGKFGLSIRISSRQKKYKNLLQSDKKVL